MCFLCDSDRNADRDDYFDSPTSHEYEEDGICNQCIDICACADTEKCTCEDSCLCETCADYEPSVDFH